MLPLRTEDRQVVPPLAGKIVVRGSVRIGDVDVREQPVRRQTGAGAGDAGRKPGSRQRARRRSVTQACETTAASHAAAHARARYDAGTSPSADRSDRRPRRRETLWDSNWPVEWQRLPTNELRVARPAAPRVSPRTTRIRTGVRAGKCG